MASYLRELSTAKVFRPYQSMYGEEDCQYVVGNKKYFSTPDIASYNLEKQFVLKIDEVRNSCFEYDYNVVKKQLYRYFNTALYKTKLHDLGKDKCMLNKVLTFIYNDYHTGNYYSNSDLYIKNYIKLNYNKILTHLDLNVFKNISYNNKYYKIYLKATIYQRKLKQRKEANIYRYTRMNVNRYNKYHCLYLDDTYYSSDDEIEIDDTPDVIQKRRERIWDDATRFVEHQIREEPIINRDSYLLSKLRYILYTFEYFRYKHTYRGCMLTYKEWYRLQSKPIEHCEAALETIEMEDLSHLNRVYCPTTVQTEMMEAETTDQQQQAGPVVLNALQQDETIETTENASNSFWTQNSTSDALVNVQHASSMEILMHTFEWSSSDMQDKLLFSLPLPIFAIASSPNHPAAMLFSQYAYWNGDIKVRVHINTTPFHIGKLIFSWYYSALFDQNHSHRDNIASAVMLPHVSYSAAEGGDVILNIPYRNYRSMLCTRKKAVNAKHLYLGSLRCHVFNPLILGTDTVVDGYVHVSFENNVFTGIMPREDIQAEMLPTRSLIKATEFALTTLDKVMNMDKPSNPAVPIMYTPQLSDSFATGIGDVTNVHMLRLTPSGQTPHPTGSSTMQEETLIQNIIRRWGLLRVITWDTTHTKGYKLFTIPCSPELNYFDYYQTSFVDGSNTIVGSVLPPVSALSVINAYNRGSLEYEVEIICSRYHTGAILISFTPCKTNVSIEQAVQSYCATIDIGTSCKYIFKVPYINERPYNPRFNREDSAVNNPQLAPIGEINVFVLNALRTVNTVSAKVYVNLFLRAGDDFELAVPVPPLYSVAYDYQKPRKTDPVWPTKISTVTGLATWRYATQTMAKDAVVLKYATTDDGVMQFVNLLPFTVYVAAFAEGSAFQDAPFVVNKYIAANQMSGQLSIEVKYIAMIIVNNDGNNYKYATAFESEASAREYVSVHKRLVTVDNPYPNSPTVNQWLSAYPSTEGMYLAIQEGAADSYRNVKFKQDKDLKFTLVYSSFTRPEVGDILVDPTISRLTSTLNGLRMFGETFSDLKDYCRRFQPYCAVKFVADKSSSGEYICIPITPVGLDTSVEKNGLNMTKIREGLIPYVASAFRFYRGSIRFKILVTRNDSNVDRTDAQGSVVYIQHRPDVVAPDRNAKIYPVYSSSTDEKFLQSGYAYTAFSLSVNNSITIEVPCYIPTNLLMLQKPNFSIESETIHYMMGTIDMFIPTMKASDEYLIQVHYALGDDMDFSCFVGFPPMVPLYTVTNVQAEMNDIEASTSKQVEDQGIEAEVQPQGIIESVKTKVTDYLSKRVVTSAFEVPLEKDDTYMDIVKRVCLKYGEKHKHLLISLISQIIHCVNAPDVSTFVIAFVTFLSHTFSTALSYMEIFVEKFKIIFSKVKNKIRGEDAGDDKTEISSMDAKQSIIRSIVEMSASCFHNGKEIIKGIIIPDFTKGLFKNVRDGAITFNVVYLLFKNVMTILPKIITWVGKTLNPIKWIRYLFGYQATFIEQWMRDVEFVIDPNSVTKVRTDLRYVYHVELLVIAGRDILGKLMKIKDKDLNKKYISDLNIKLNDTYKAISSFNKGAGSIGIEPFCVCIVGSSQVGKTYVSKELAADCLKAINYRTYEDVFYTRPQVSQYWDGVENQPVCLYDDFLHMKYEASAGPMIGEFLLLKSKATFQPNRAHLDDKGKKYSPLMILLTMNAAYPDFSSMTLENNAWMNRRDVMFEAVFVAPQEYPNAKTVNDLPNEVLSSYKHVKLRKYKYRSTSDDANALTLFDTLEVPRQNSEGELISTDGVFDMYSTEWLTFKQAKWYLSNEFVKKYEVMKREYLKDLALVQSFYPEPMEEFDVNIDRFIAHIKQHEAYFNARESKTIKLAEQFLKGTKCNVCDTISTRCLCNSEIFYRPRQIQAEAPRFSEAICKVAQSSKVNKVVDVDRCVVQFKQELSAHDLFSKFSDEFKDALVSDYATAVRKNDFGNWFKAVLEHGCIYSIVYYYRTVITPIVFARPEEKGLFMDVMDEEYNVEIQCKKCKEDAGFCKNYYAYMLSACDPSGFDFVPNYFIDTKDTVIKKTNKFAERSAKDKELILTYLRVSISPSTWLGALSEFIHEWSKPIGYALGLLGTMVTVMGVRSYMSARNEKNADKDARKDLNMAVAKLMETHEPTDNCLRGQCNICTRSPEMAYDMKHKIDPKRLRATETKSIVPEMAADLMKCLDIRLRRNYFYIRATTPDLREIVVRCLGIQERWFIGIDHYFEKFQTLPLGTTYEFCRADTTMLLDMSKVKVQRIKKSALYICELPKTFSAFKNLLQYIAPANVIQHHGSQASLYVPELPNERRVMEVFSATWYANKIKFHDDILEVPSDVNNGCSTVSAYWSYMTSGKGLCGSVLVSDQNLQCPIIGMHIAGQTRGGCGYSEVMVRETFESFFNQLPTPILINDVQTEGMNVGDINVPFIYDPTTLKSALPGIRDFIGTVPNKYAYKPPTKSRCKHSMAYNRITQSTYDFPHLSHRDERFEGSPMIAGCLHHVDPPMSFPDDVVELAHDDIRSKILYNVIPLRQRVGRLSLNQAVVGIPEIPHYDAMEFSTSEGFPFTSFRPKTAKDKRWLFDLEETSDGYLCHGIDERVISVMEDKSDMRTKGIVPATVFVDCLKDIKLPKEKCQKTRIFSISPVDFTIQFRQLFYDYTIAFQESRFDIESAIGINVDSYEWHDMVQSLMENSSHFVCGDYSKFGPRLMSDIVMRSFEIIADWYVFNGDLNEINRKHRIIMGYEVAFSKHLMLNLIYQVYCGAPSGSPITTILNNMVNMFYIRCAYIEIMRKYNKKLVTLDNFHRCVRIIFYGDDLIMTVAEEILEFFNASALSEYFAQYDIKFTDALKTGEMELSADVFARETSFLKRNIKRHPRRPIFVAAMDKRAIEETCNWIFEGHDDLEASILASEAMLLNAHGWGPEYYEGLRRRVFDFWLLYNEYPNIPSWLDVDYRIYDGGV